MMDMRLQAYIDSYAVQDRGEVQMQFTIEKDGTITAIQPLKPSNSFELNQAAKRALEDAGVTGIALCGIASTIWITRTGSGARSIRSADRTPARCCPAATAVPTSKRCGPCPPECGDDHDRRRGAGAVHP